MPDMTAEDIERRQKRARAANPNPTPLDAPAPQPVVTVQCREKEHTIRGANRADLHSSGALVVSDGTGNQVGFSPYDWVQFALKPQGEEVAK